MENLLIGAREASNELKHARKSGARKSSVSAASSLGGVQASFKEFMQNLGSNAGKGINVTVDNSGIGNIEDRSGRQLNRSENDYSRSDDYSRSARPADDGNRGDNYGNRSRAESRDDRGRNGSSGRPDGARDERRGDGRTAGTEGTTANRQQNTRTGDRPDGSNGASKAPSDNQGSNDVSAKSGQATGKKVDNGDSTKGGNAQDASGKANTAQDKPKKSIGNDISTVDTAIIAAAGTAINLINTGQVKVSPTNSSLSSSLAGTGKNDIAEQVLGQNISKTKTKNSRTKVAGNILTKVGAKSDEKAKIGAKAGATAKTGVKADNAVKTGAKTGANTNSAANEQSRIGSDMDPAFKSRLAQQAAGISKSVGTGAGVKVSVNVTKESEVLVSRPASTLISQLAVSGGNAKQTRNGKSSVSTGNKAASQISRQAKGDIGQAVDKQTKAQLSQLRPEAASQAKSPAQLASQNSANSQKATFSSGGDTLLTGGPGGAGEPGQSQQSTAAKTETPKRAAFVRQPTINQISVQISKAVAAGVDKINIQLKPDSLGRIEVSLEVAKNGHVSAVVVADNKNTLDLLQNGSDELKQALQNAGLNTDSGSLSFGLREENHSSGGRDGGAGRSADDRGSAGGGDGSVEADIAAIRNTDIITNSKVDVRA